MGVNISALFVFPFSSYLFFSESPLKMLLWNGTMDLTKTVPTKISKKGNVQIRHVSDEELPYGVLFISKQKIAFGETLAFNTFIQPPQKKGNLNQEER